MMGAAHRRSRFATVLRGRVAGVAEDDLKHAGDGVPLQPGHLCDDGRGVAGRDGDGAGLAVGHLEQQPVDGRAHDSRSTSCRARSRAELWGSCPPRRARSPGQRRWSTSATVIASTERSPPLSCPRPTWSSFSEQPASFSWTPYARSAFGSRPPFSGGQLITEDPWRAHWRLETCSQTAPRKIGLKSVDARGRGR